MKGIVAMTVLLLAGLTLTSLLAFGIDRHARLEADAVYAASLSHRER